jgi:hypothetical protein
MTSTAVRTNNEELSAYPESFFIVGFFFLAFDWQSLEIIFELSDIFKGFASRRKSKHDFEPCREHCEH